jgi:hypothetical protein
MRTAEAGARRFDVMSSWRVDSLIYNHSTLPVAAWLSQVNNNQLQKTEGPYQLIYNHSTHAKLQVLLTPKFIISRFKGANITHSDLRNQKKNSCMNLLAYQIR